MLAVLRICQLAITRVLPERRRGQGSIGQDDRLGIGAALLGDGLLAKETEPMAAPFGPYG
jgi:hypothetical protein